MKKSLSSLAYWGSCVLLFIGIMKVSPASNLFAFSHSCEFHGDEHALRKEAERIMKKEAAERMRIFKDKERKEMEEKKEKERKERERKRQEELARRKEEEKRAYEEHRKDLDKRSKR